MKIAITIVKVLMAITLGLIAGLAVLLMLPLLFTFALTKIMVAQPPQFDNHKIQN